MAGESPSNTQLDKLGDRLRAGSRDEPDLRALDDYRRSFRSAYDRVATTVRAKLDIEGTGRPAKTTSAIVEKLNRQKIRLTQIQDIAGFRIVVNGVLEQDRVVRVLTSEFQVAGVDDRRVTPSHGYRAVHVIAAIGSRLVEIQVRTREQHLWAELSEKLADVIDPDLKYGQGPKTPRETLLAYSFLLASVESIERTEARIRESLRTKEATLDLMETANPDYLRQVQVVQSLRERVPSGDLTADGLKKKLATLLIDYYNELMESDD